MHLDAAVSLLTDWWIAAADDDDEDSGSNDVVSVSISVSLQASGPNLCTTNSPDR